MITLVFAIILALGSFAASYLGLDWGLGWSVFIGIAGFALFQGFFGVLVQKRVKREMDRVQGILVAGQKRIQTKMQRWQMRPPGSVQAAQREIFNDTKVFVKEALKESASLSRFRLWVPMIDRQQATLQLQLNWMIKDFAAVDRLMPKALFFDASLAALKMARMYMLGAKTEDIEKIYLKAARRARYNGNVLLAGAWSWMLVHRGDTDGAFKALTQALKKSDNEVLKANHEKLMNNRVEQFSNSALGEQWYSLYLEEPKVRSQRQRSVYR